MSAEKGRSCFEVKLDVSSFHSDDLKVNVRDRELIITGRHDERDEDGAIVERHFIRKYVLPKSALEDEMTSELGADGILKVIVPTNEAAESRKIPIKVDPNWKMRSNPPSQELILRQPIPLWWW